MSEYTVFEQNNIGVAHLANGNMGQAFSCFRIAFDEARKCRNMDNNNNNNNNNNASHGHSNPHGSSSSLLSSSKAPLHWPFMVRNQVIDTLKSAAMNDARRHGFMISINSLLQGHSNKVDMTLTSAFVIFNLALVYCISGNYESNERLILKSRRLFDSCRQLLLPYFNRIHRCDTSLPTENPLIDLLWIMTLTKLAETNYMLSNFKYTEGISDLLNNFVNLIRLNPTYESDFDVKQLLEFHCQRLLWVSNKSRDVPKCAPAA